MKGNTGERVKNRRVQLGYTVDEVAEMLGKSRATIYRYEGTDTGKMALDLIEPLAKVLQTTVAYLLGLTDDPVQYQPKVALSVGAKIQHRQQQKNMTNTELAQKVMISQQKLTDIKEGDTQDFSLALMQRFCDALGCNISYFLDGREPVEDISKNIVALLEINEESIDNIEDKLIVDVYNPTFSDIEHIADYFGLEFDDIIFKDFTSAKSDPLRRTIIKSNRFARTIFEGMEA